MNINATPKVAAGLQISPQPQTVSIPIMGSNEPMETPQAPPEAKEPASPGSQEMVLVNQDNDALEVAKDWKLPYMSEAEEAGIWERTDKVVAAGGLSKRITKDYFRAKEEFGRLMKVKLTPEVMGVNLMESSEILQDAIREAGRVLEGNSSAADKLNALMAITLAARAQGELTLKMAKIYRAGQRDASQARPKVNSSKAPSADIPFQIVAERVEINNSNDSAKSGAPTPE